MKTTAKNLFLTALTISSVAFAVDIPVTAAAGAEVSIGGSVLPLKRLAADDQSFWDKFRDSVMKDKPEEAEQPRVVERKPAERPREAEKPKPIERRTVAMTISNSKKPIKNPSQQNNPSPPYQPVRPPYQTPAPPYNPGSTPPPSARE